MVPDADAFLEKLPLGRIPRPAPSGTPPQKLKQDPRITVVGRLLRKTSLDELPQLINVLTGDMSLVGPRPIMVNQKALYPGRRYYDMRPGLTGLWQVSDRNECSFAERVRVRRHLPPPMSFWHRSAHPGADGRWCCAAPGIDASGRPESPSDLFQAADARHPVVPTRGCG
jgi:exopolysaccharide production protein ExoY